MLFDSIRPQSNGSIEMHPLEEHGIPYCTTSIRNIGHLNGVQLDILAPPFTQQNPAIGVCATASLWSASKILAERFDLNKFSYDTITKQAISPKGSHPSVRTDWKFGQGLTSTEIREALSCTGASVLVLPPAKGEAKSAQARMRLLAYTFVESGLPVIACYVTSQSGHAVTLVGHLLPNGGAENDTAESEAELVYGKYINHDRHHLIGMSTQLYYAHNDAYGPYDRIQILSDQEASKSKATKPKHVAIATGRDKKDASLAALLVPLPPYVQNQPERVLADAIARFDVYFNPDKEKGNKQKVLWRCLLASSSDFKQSLLRRQFDCKIQERYIGMHLPLYIWLVEFTIVHGESLPEGESIPTGSNRKVHGEFVYDCTTPYYEPFCVSIRVGNRFRDCRIDNGLLPTGAQRSSYSCYVPTERIRQESA